MHFPDRDALMQKDTEKQETNYWMLAILGNLNCYTQQLCRNGVELLFFAYYTETHIVYPETIHDYLQYNERNYYRSKFQF